ncbi:hypothetical protein Vretifemale_5620 [Volvox reticuliferus]|nr:hypothetical protein Vretifemale_5620 [Volvox reticuliferus]
MPQHQLQELLDKPVSWRGINPLGGTPGRVPGQPKPNVSAAKDVERVAAGSLAEAAFNNKMSTLGDKERPPLPSTGSDLAHGAHHGQGLHAAMTRVGAHNAHHDAPQRAKKRQKSADAGTCARGVQDTTAAPQHPAGAATATAAGPIPEQQDQLKSPAERPKSRKKVQLQQEQKQQHAEQQSVHKMKELQPEVPTKTEEKLRRDRKVATGAAVTAGVSQPGPSGDELQPRVAKKPRLQKVQEGEKPFLGRYAVDEPKVDKAVDADELKHKKQRLQVQLQRPPPDLKQPGQQQAMGKHKDDKVKMNRMEDERVHAEETQEECGLEARGRGAGKGGPKGRGLERDRGGEGPYNVTVVATAVESREEGHHPSQQKQKQQGQHKLQKQLLQEQKAGEGQVEQPRTRGAKHGLHGNDTPASQQRHGQKLEKQKRGQEPQQQQEQKKEQPLAEDQPLNGEGKNQKQKSKQQQLQKSTVAKARKKETDAETDHVKANLLGSAADTAHFPLPPLATSSLAIALGGRAAIAAAAAAAGTGAPSISAAAKPAAGPASSGQKQTHAAALAALQQWNAAASVGAAAAAAAAAAQSLPSADDGRNGGGNGTTAAALATAAVRQVGLGQKAPGKKAAAGFLDKMRAKLAGGRFRYLNEELYTRSGKEAFRMMQSQPELFSQYHEGFQRQTRGWPKQPVDVAIGWLKSKK